MRAHASKILFTAGAAVFFIAVARNQAQPTPFGQTGNLGHATDFTSVQYFEPPDDRKVKVKLSGAEAAPLPGGLLDVKQLKVEMFGTNGSPTVVVQAPQCNYSLFGGGAANSAGRLELTAMGGKLHVEGEGFLFRQVEQSLTISNRVRTTIEFSIFSEQKTAL
jgi:hypothetical protein